MTKVFIGGSRKVGRLNADVRSRVDTIIEKRLPVIVGDANGVDKAVQAYLETKGYDLVEVFCTEGKCRNNVGHWPVRPISAGGQRRGFGFFAAKDRAMAEEATVGLMIWDGKSVGTLMNMMRLLREKKKVVVYVAPKAGFEHLEGENDLNALVSHHAPELRDRLDRESMTEQRITAPPRQASLL